MAGHVKVHETQNLSEAHLISAFLQTEGIQAEVRVAGATPDPATGKSSGGAQVWVPAEQESQALELLELAERASESSLHVACPRCNENNPAHFERCWKCQAKLITASGAKKQP